MERIYNRNYKRIWDCLETLLFLIYPSCLRPFFGSILLKNTFRPVSEGWWKSEKVKRNRGELEHTLLSSEARWVRVVRGDGGEGRRQQKKFDKLDAAEGWISRDVCSPSFGSCWYSNTVVHQVKDATEQRPSSWHYNIIGKTVHSYEKESDRVELQ